MKAMILAAGLGTRLRPITNATPKALILVEGRPLIVYSLLILKKYGFQEVVINLHHLGDLIERELGDGRKFGLRISYSWEPVLLGTGGGINKASSFFQDEPALVLNSDVLMDLNLKTLLSFHARKKGLATMVVQPREAHAAHTPIAMNRSGRILSIGGQEKENTDDRTQIVTYTGAQVIEPDLLNYLPQEETASCIIRDAYQPALRDKKKIFGFLYDGYWNDLGTVDRHRQAEEDLSNKRVRLSYI